MATISKDFRVKTGLIVDSGNLTVSSLTTAGLALVSASGVFSTSAAGYGDTYNPYGSKTANFFLAAPNGSAGAPTFRAIVAADIPTLNQNTTGQAGSVANSLVLKADTGTTEGTDLYTFNGSAAKTLNIVAGSNITITKSAGQWSIAAAASPFTFSAGTTGFTNAGTATAWQLSGTLVVANGGTGATTLTSNGVLLGNGTSAISATTAGTADQVLRVPSGGGAPAFGAIDLSKSAAVTGILPVANGGNGTSDGSVTGTGALTFTAGGTNTNINLVPNGTGTVDVASKKITNVADPTLDTDAANKRYVDAARTGLDAKASVRVASAGTNVTVTYNATGGTSTRGQITSAPNTIDGVSLAANDRILLKDQTAGAQNGIWVVSTLGTGANGVWDRAVDFDSDLEVTAGAYVWVEEGTVNQDSAWVLTTNNPITIGGASGTVLTWVLFSSAGSLVAGAGLTKTGNAIDIITASSARIVVNADNIDLATTAVTANSYGVASDIQYPTFTVDSYGRLTAAATTTIRDATTALKGVASFSSSQFTVTTGAVSITSLAGSVINSGTVSPTYGGTGVNNGSSTITLGGNFTTSGAFATTLTVTGTTNVTLPTTGTLATLAGAESLTNKKLGSLTTNGLVTTSNGDGTLSVTTMGAGIATFLSTPSSANLISAITDEVGSGFLVFNTNPTFAGTYTATPAPAFRVDTNGGMISGSGSTTGTTAMTLTNLFDKTAYNGAEFIVKAAYNTTDYEIIKILVLVVGTNFYITQYGDVQSNAKIVDVDFTLSTNNVNMTITPVAGQTLTTTAKVIGTLLAV